jgi:large subunit ribosomal protein LP0
MVGGAKAQKKNDYFVKVKSLLDEYPQLFVVSVDNVGASHLQKIRKLLRQFNSVILMGKNTLIRKAMRDHLTANPKLEELMPFVRGNCGFVMCKGHLKEILDILESERVAAPAKPGAIAPVAVTIPAGNTGLEPTQTSFLQALNIATKISRGQIEILKDVHLFGVGDRVGSSEAALLDKLNIKPFTYGLSVKQVYDDGTVYDVAVIKITDDDLIAKFMSGVARIASLSLAIGFPTLAALPHAIINGYKNVVAVALATDYTFDQIADLKKLLDDPEALAKAAAAAAAPAAGGAAAAPAEAAKEEEEEEESEEEMAFDLFD